MARIMPRISSGYEEDNTFSANEHRLFVQLLPDRTLKFKWEKFGWGKMSKEPLTVLVCVLCYILGSLQNWGVLKTLKIF